MGCFFCVPVFAQIDTSAGNNYNDELSALGVVLIPPAGWKKRDAPCSADDGVGIFLAQPQNKAMISIVWNKRLGTDEESFHSALISYKETIKNIEKLISEKEISFSGSRCYVLDIEIGGKNKSRDYIFFKNDKAYNLTYTASAEEFNNYLSVFEEMLRGFKMLD